MIVAFDKYIREIYYRFCSPFQDALFPNIDQAGELEVLRGFLAVIGFAVPEEVAHLSHNTHRLDFFATVPIAVQQLYEYAHGDIVGVSWIDDLIIPYCQLLRVLSSIIYPPNFSDEIELQNVLHREISERFANAYQIQKLRKKVEKYIFTYKTNSGMSLSEINPILAKSYIYDLETLTTSEFTFLASISYPYTMKLIREKYISAIRDELSNWRIPIRDALIWIQARNKECPRWLKRIEIGQ